MVANLAALRVGRISAFGAVGIDPFGERLLALLADLNVDCGGMLQVDDATAWQTLAYCKPYVGEEELPRLDLGNFNRLPDAAAVDLLQRLEEALGNLDIVIVNQQVSAGIHTPYFRRELRSLMRRYPGSTFVFDGRHYTDSYPEAWLKVNSREALRLCSRQKDPHELVLRTEAVAAARELYERNRRPTFVTRGSRGCLVCTGAGVTEVPGLQTIGPTDPVSASARAWSWRGAPATASSPG